MMDTKHTLYAVFCILPLPFILLLVAACTTPSNPTSGKNKDVLNGLIATRSGGIAAEVQGEGGVSRVTPPCCGTSVFYLAFCIRHFVYYIVNLQELYDQ